MTRAVGYFGETDQVIHVLHVDILMDLYKSFMDNFFCEPHTLFFLEPYVCMLIYLYPVVNQASLDLVNFSSNLQSYWRSQP
jgi:hypothetical protein